jgi:hypothetical protein
MTPEEIAASRYRCQHDGCMRHPDSGDTIIRTSPKGEPFAGLCEAEHYPGSSGEENSSPRADGSAP